MIDVIKGEPCSGKTTKLLYKAGQEGGVVFCKNPHRMQEKAAGMGISNLTFVPYDYMNINLEEVSPREENIYIDDIESLLEYISNGKIKGFTIVT